MSATVHPSSVIAEGVELGEGVVIGPFCVVEGPSRIGTGTVLKSHAVVGPHTEIGRDCVLYPHSAVGLDPQDLKFKGAATRLVVGDRNVFRENTTVHRGTEHGGGVTKLGDDNFLMAGAHVAHDCIVGIRTSSPTPRRWRAMWRWDRAATSALSRLSTSSAGWATMPSWAASPWLPRMCCPT